MDRTGQAPAFFAIARRLGAGYQNRMIKYPIFLLRHGQTTWNLEGRLQGRLNSPLTEKGRSQALQQRAILGAVFATYPNIPVHSSPLERAHETAILAAEDRDVTTQDMLMEVSAGSWEGRLRADIVAQRGGSAEEKDMFDLFLSAPDGEGAAALEARCRAYLASLTGPTVIVSHGVVSAFLRGLIRGLTLPEISRLPHSQGVVFALENGVEHVLSSRTEADAYIASSRAKVGL
ncbi:putative phosphoglycerate mutase [Pacificibacter maritimus]|uniref:Putative phosphoglycerate mutase n=1 Tax=Pacificibacter maritimus TaxID=762213 RepID=A0A3N4VFN6_9RHOB|nr:histidine phosphatase family protein [Pacificibacter maritimus]RPE71744.1 putative phosphoglycerate mutase [Pacificibacter maritimus]